MMRSKHAFYSLNGCYSPHTKCLDCFRAARKKALSSAVENDTLSLTIMYIEMHRLYAYSTVQCVKQLMIHVWSENLSYRSSAAC